MLTPDPEKFGHPVDESSPADHANADIIESIEQLKERHARDVGVVTVAYVSQFGQRRRRPAIEDIQTSTTFV